MNKKNIVATDIPLDGGKAVMYVWPRPQGLDLWFRMKLWWHFHGHRKKL